MLSAAGADYLVVGFVIVMDHKVSFCSELTVLALTP
jgi:hypothetical protein